MSRRQPSKNAYVRARVKAAKGADQGRRLPVKPQGVKFTNGSGGRHLPAPSGAKRSDDSPKARVSRTPRVLPAIKGHLLKAPSTYVGRLSCVSDWHKQVSRIYRAMWLKQIEANLGTKLTFVANIGATMARWMEENAPVGVNVPPNYDLLSADELAQLEHLLAKAAGPREQERLEQSTAGVTYDG
jgi:hypothetical protein